MSAPTLDLTLHPAFVLLDHHHIEALSLDVLVCEHTQTKARHYHLAHPNDENTFMVGFRTQPMDDTGVAHILEHTALCGSIKYPVRDPFFSMIKRSLNTFMNAFTASDWTAYPFATQNRQDYFNLLSVYLDAAFFPNLDPLDFAQEGIRVELDDSERPIFKGVVFNEMKGAMSSEVSQLYQAVAKHLYPKTTYHYNSGGEPAAIPNLTHADLVAFHQSHYHPSNAVIMSFGNIAVADIQQTLHDNALVQFDMGKKHVSVAEQRLNQPITATETYAVDKITEKQTHHVLAWLLPEMTNAKMRLAMRLMEGVLLEHAGSPLRAFLESHKLGTAASPILGLDDNHYEMTFYAGLRGSEPEHAEVIEQGILDLLTDIASKPIATEDIETILHQIELNQRHISGDGMPYGLSLMLEGFSSAIHDGNPLDTWEINEQLTWLRNQVQNPMWLPNLIKTHLLDNTHRVRLTLVPDANKSQQTQQQEQQRLDNIASKLTNADKQQLQHQAKALATRQATEDDLSLLPKVGLADIPTHLKITEGVSQTLTAHNTSIPLHTYTTGTNGLYYYQLLLELPENLSQHPLLATYTSLLGELGTHKLTARMFQAKQAAHSGGVSVTLSQRTNKGDKNRYKTYLVLATRALTRKPEAIHLVQQVLLDTVFNEYDRIKELLQQKQASWQSRLAASGHAYAMQTAANGYSKQASLDYARGGLPALKALTTLVKQIDQQAKDNSQQTLTNYCQQLTELHQHITALPKQLILVSEAQEQAQLVVQIQQSLTTLATHTTTVAKPPELNSNHADKAWLIQTNVFFNASVYAAVPADHADAPALMILAPYLRNGYLHRAIREQGGAYGGGAAFDTNACAFKFYSYRDPRCADTFADFTASIDWLLNEPQTPSQLEEAILGVIASMDKPASPAGEAVKACHNELHARDSQWQQMLREKILQVDLADLRRVANVYLKNQAHSRASLAPFDKADMLKDMGFVVDKLA